MSEPEREPVGGVVEVRDGGEVGDGDFARFAATRGDRSPFEVFGFIYGGEAAAKLGLRRIPPNEVTLTRKLLEVELPEYPPE